MLSIAITIVGMIVFVFLPRKMQFYIFSMSAFFQFTFGKLGSIPDFLFIEWITPLYFIIMLNELIPLRNSKRQEKLIDFRGTEIFIFALFLLVLTAVVSYARNEILSPQNYFMNETTGIRRTYFGIANNILIFFTTIIYLSLHFEEIEIEKWIKLLLIASIIIGLFRIVIYLFNIPFPFMAGGFDYNPGVSRQFGGLTYRIGGLAEATLVGTSALFADFYLKKKLNVFFAIVLLFILFMSGGRTILVATIVAITIYSTFFLKRSFIYLIFLGAIGIIVAIIVLPPEIIEGQIGRMTAFTGGIQHQSSDRYTAFLLLLKSFQHNPFFGKGISDYHGVIFAQNEQIQDFINQSRLVEVMVVILLFWVFLV